jgi:hypothetical protein
MPASGFVIAAFLGGCGAGSATGTPLLSSASPAATHVAGMLTITEPVDASATSRARSPAFVSPSTRHAALFIDGATVAAGTSACSTSGTSGTGTACAIPWSAVVSVPASHVFTVEIDNGAAATPANTVLAEGRASYALISGNANVLTPTLSLNGVIATATFSATSCTPSSCGGNVQLGAAAGILIAYSGALTVPTTGNSPSTGTVYDNGSVTFASSNTAVGGGLITGIAQSSAPSVFSTYAGNVLTVSGVNTTGIYTFQATCNATGTGTFGITTALAGAPSLDVSAAELAALSPAVVYPSGISVLTTAPSFSCTNGAIADSFATLPIN